jgi:3-hydroxyacyl-[acyl-carrier-protein] dehydratase
MPATIILDPSEIDWTQVVCDIHAIRALNPQRDNMESLDAIVSIDRQKHIIAGYRDIHHDEFWVSGHMPGMPLFPGVMMLESAAQLASFYTKQSGVLDKELLGLGGIEGARFRAPVRPGDRLLLIGKGLRVDRRQTKFYVTGYVGSTLAFHVEIIGVPIPGDEIVNSYISAESAQGCTELAKS